MRHRTILANWIILSATAFGLGAGMDSLDFKQQETEVLKKNNAGEKMELLKRSYPNAWENLQTLKDIGADSGLKARLNDDSLLNRIQAEKESGSIDELVQKLSREEYDIIYLRNKTDFDVARSKYYLSPYHANYVYGDVIGDSSREGKYVGTRPAMKFQISQKFPLWTTRYYANGAYFAMTLRGLFDLSPWGENSAPVTKKTFMPEAFVKFDLGTLRYFRFLRSGISERSDKNVLQLGIHHESNGGYVNEYDGFTSRSIGYRRYLEYRGRFRVVDSLRTDGLRRIPTSRFAGKWYARIFDLHSVGENDSIEQYIGWSELGISYELLGGGVWNGEATFSPGDFLGTEKEYRGISYSLGLAWTPPWDKQSAHSTHRFPVSFYLRYFYGFNEFLETFNVKTRVWGMGFILR